MVGGQFQGSNDGTNYTTLATITTQPASNQYSTLALGSTLYRYLRYLSPNGTYTVLAEVEFYNGTTRLTGTGFGTSGSYSNQGNGFERALDDDPSTFFDAPTNTSSFVGIDIQATPALDTLTARFYPRADVARAMVGGQFQGSNDGTNYVTLAVINSKPAENQYSTIGLGSTLYGYLRYVSPNGTYTVLADIEFYNNGVRLTGTGFGTAGSYGNFGNTFSKALDGNPSTFFDAPTNTGSFVGINTGSTPPPTTGTVALTARYYPRIGYAWSMNGGKLQGSNDGTNYTTLATINGYPPENQYSTIDLGSTWYRYLRYQSPGYTNTVLAEVEFYNNGVRLTGTAFGTAGSYVNFGNTFSKALDGNPSTFFDAPTPAGGFVGIDTGS